MPQVAVSHDAQKAMAAARQGMTQIEQNTDEHWRQTAIAAAIAVARRRERLTTDDVWAALSSEGMEYQPHDAGAMGPIMKHLEKQGFIAKIRNPIGRGFVKVPSIRETSHSRSVTLWESRVHYSTD